MRSMWKGAISFGLVTIPVKLYTATEQRDVSFRQVHVKDGGRIHFRRVCSVDDEEVPYADVAKGYELPRPASTRAVDRPARDTSMAMRLPEVPPPSTTTLKSAMC